MRAENAELKRKLKETEEALEKQKDVWKNKSLLHPLFKKIKKILNINTITKTTGNLLNTITKTTVKKRQNTTKKTTDTSTEQKPKIKKWQSCHFLNKLILKKDKSMLFF